MTPKEKALELVKKYGILAMSFETSNSNSLTLNEAKQCALIAVEEIEKVYKLGWDIENKFWKEVKQQIKEL